MKFANRMDRFGEGVFSMLAQMKKKKLAEGEMIVDLSIGAPNIAPAPHILKALSEACLVPENYLYAIQDQQALLEAVSDWYARRYGVELNPETEICSLLGSQEGLAHIALSIVDEGDVVLVPDPCYPVFADGPSLAGAELYYMPQREENHYIIDLKEIPEEVAQKAKFMIVSYPNNPTAVLAPDSFYEELIAFAKKYDIIVLHDTPTVSLCLTEEPAEVSCVFRAHARSAWSLIRCQKRTDWRARASASVWEMRKWSVI